MDRPSARHLLEAIKRKCPECHVVVFAFAEDDFALEVQPMQFFLWEKYDLGVFLRAYPIIQARWLHAAQYDRFKRYEQGLAAALN